MQNFNYFPHAFFMLFWLAVMLNLYLSLLSSLCSKYLVLLFIFSTSTYYLFNFVSISSQLKYYRALQLTM
jgi:hypothetical protein